MTTCVDSCDKPVHIKKYGLCQTHYNTHYRKNTLDQYSPEPLPPCIGPECDRLSYVQERKLCKAHYKQWQKGKELTPIKTRRTVKLSDRDKYLRHWYGITEAQYLEMLDKQNGMCAIPSCGRTEEDEGRSLAVSVSDVTRS
jgi:hypothetical protein